MQDIKRNARELMEFLDKSPVNFFAVRTACEMLDEAGFTRLDPAESWTLRPGGRYYITKNQSAVFAFTLGPGQGVRRIPHHLGPQRLAHAEGQAPPRDGV